MGGDQKSAKVKAARANLVHNIAERRRELESYINQLRQLHGNAPVDHALDRLEQRERISITPRK